MAICISHYIIARGRCISALEPDGSPADIQQACPTLGCDIINAME